MPRLDIDFVKFLSLVDDPAVDDARYLVTKRHDAADSAGANDEQQPAEPAESGATRTDTDSLDMEPEELDERLEEHREQTIEAATEAVGEEIEKRFDELDIDGSEDPEEDPEPDRNLTDADLVALEKRLGDGEEDEIEVSEERVKEIKAVVKGMGSEGRKAEATQTDGEGTGESEGYSDSFVADAAAGSGGDD